MQEDIRIANGEYIRSEGRGMVKLLLNRHTGDKSPITLILNTIYAPVLDVNLLSPNALGVEHSLRVNLDIPSYPSQILNRETIVRNLIHQNNLYLVDLTDMGNTNTNIHIHATAANIKSIFLWHRRLAHIGLDSVRKLQNHAVGIEIMAEPKNLAERPKNLAEKPKILRTPCQACI